MKKLLVGLITLGSISCYAQSTVDRFLSSSSDTKKLTLKEARQIQALKSRSRYDEEFDEGFRDGLLDFYGEANDFQQDLKIQSDLKNVHSCTMLKISVNIDYAARMGFINARAFEKNWKLVIKNVDNNELVSLVESDQMYIPAIIKKPIKTGIVINGYRAYVKAIKAQVPKLETYFLIKRDRVTSLDVKLIEEDRFSKDDIYDLGQLNLPRVDNLNFSSVKMNQDAINYSLFPCD